MLHRFICRLSVGIFSRALVAVLLVAAAATARAQGQHLVVWKTNGEKVYYDLAEQPKTTFSNNNLVIAASDLTISYPLSEVLRYTYDLGTTGIADGQVRPGVRMAQQGDQLVFRHLPAETPVQLFSADGKLLSTLTADGSGRLTLSLAQRPTGIYIVKACGVTYKLLKR